MTEHGICLDESDYEALTYSHRHIDYDIFEGMTPEDYEYYQMSQVPLSPSKQVDSQEDSKIWAEIYELDLLPHLCKQLGVTTEDFHTHIRYESFYIIAEEYRWRYIRRIYREAVEKAKKSLVSKVNESKCVLQIDLD
jgi:hypothetical protein